MEQTDKKRKVLNIVQLIGWIVLATGLIVIAAVWLVDQREITVMLGPAALICIVLGMAAVIISRTLKKERMKQWALLEKFSEEEAEYQALKDATKNFLDNVVYPEGFEDFIKKSESKWFGLKDENYLPFEVFALDEISEKNMDLIVDTNDYLTKFKDALLFACDESGHVYLFLDYGNNRTAPAVKTLDEELDEIRTVCENFGGLLDLAVYEEE